MNTGQPISPKAFAGLALRLIVIGCIGAPIAFATIFTMPLSLLAAFGGEGILAAVLYFPVGWAFAVMFAGGPGLVVALVLLAYRWFAGPWTTRRIVLILTPLCWLLAAIFIMVMDSATFDKPTELVGGVVAGGFYAVLFMCIISFFWFKRDRLGLQELAQ